MGLRNVLCNLSTVAAITMAVLLGTGCSATPTARQGDWRESVKAGDFRSAYSDLYENWRAGTPDVKAETLRYAWRDARIIAVARPDLVARIQPVADAHQGDLQTLARSLKDGPLEDRIDFAKLVDRKLDVDREIALAHEHRRRAEAQPVPTPRAASSPSPATTPPPAASPPPAVESRPRAAPQPAAPPQAAAPSQPATAPQPTAKPQPNTKPQAATPPQPKVEPEPAARPIATARPVIQSDHVAQVAEAKRRAVWRCKGTPACDKAWAAAESFVGLNTDMRIRTAKSPTIETYPPIEIGKVGLKVEKFPLENDESELRLTVHCRVGALRQLCPATELRIYAAFPAYMGETARR